MPTLFKISLSAIVATLLCSLSVIAAPMAENRSVKTLDPRWQAALTAKGSDYVPRTEHTESDGRPIYTNRLILEDSPYLLQHAHNPVDWYPWGEEAFAAARRQGKAIFLSIGYATCHWCHVMERESFENVGIAKLLNQHFIAIKVDRERRPDVDAVYMNAVMLLTRRGGWPMSVFLTPEGKPFFGGTYYPPTTFSTLLTKVHTVWDSHRIKVEEQAGALANAVQQVMNAKGQARKVGEETIRRGVDQLMLGYDPVQGGFRKTAPKFPNEPILMLLLDHAQRHADKTVLKALTHTLSAMARGGMYDQIGGGFHRYSTDARWLVPHFEKMLYNQAYLARIYTQAYRITGNHLFARVARQTLDYVLRDMRSPAGGFYSASDADSDGHEGTYFIWTGDEITKVLGVQDGAFAIQLFGVTVAGNFEGKTILHLPVPMTQLAVQQDIPLNALLERVDKVREKLRQERIQRVPPLVDRKVLVAWNGMLITALAEAAEVFAEQRYIKAATGTAEFLWANQRDRDGMLWRVNLGGKRSITAQQDDYAHFAEALIGLYDATGDTEWLERASQLADQMYQKFWDAEQGGFLMGADDILFLRPKRGTDAAIPSGNSVAVVVLAKLAAHIGEIRYEKQANDTIAAFSQAISQHPSAYPYMLTGINALLQGEAGPNQYAARGAVKASAQVAGEGPEKSLTLKLDIQPGWHVNGNQPNQQELIGTELRLSKATSAWKLRDMAYPHPLMKKLKFEELPLALYEGEVILHGKLTKVEKTTGLNAPIIPLELRIQACNDQVCLPPEVVVLEIPLPGCNYSAHPLLAP